MPSITIPIKLFLNWIWRMLIWLFNFKSPFLWAVSVPLVIFCSYFLFSNWELRFRMSGMFLQLMGVVTVAWGLMGAHKLFSKAGFTEIIKKWFMSIPPFTETSSVHMGVGNVQLEGITGSAYGTVSLANAPSLEEKMELIEKVLNNLNKQQGVLDKKIDTNAKEHALAIENEKKFRERSIQQVKELIREIAVGGIHIESIGVIWIFFGIIFATIPKELVCLFFCLPNS